MVFIEELRNGFFKPLERLAKNERVLVVAAQDTDAVCAVRILETLLEANRILFSRVTVDGKTSLEQAFVEHSDEVKNLILINCGASIDLVALLEPAEDSGTVFYVCDSRRPVDHCNAYNLEQVKLLGSKNELAADLPEFDDLFQEDSDSDESDDSNDSDTNEETLYRKRRRLDAATLERRRQRREFNRRKERLLFEYSQFSWHGRSSALVMFELAVKLSLDSSHMLWLAIIGVTDQLVTGRINRDLYWSQVQQLQMQVTRLCSADNRPASAVGEHLQITAVQDLSFPVYRHWTLEKSMSRSLEVVSALKLWTVRGRGRLNEFLAEMGLPKSQCQNAYQSMDSLLRSELRQRFDKVAVKYGLSLSSVLAHGFLATVNRGLLVSSFDMATAAFLGLFSSCRLEPSARFLQVQDLLEWPCPVSRWQNAVDLSKQHLEAVVSQMGVIFEKSKSLILKTSSIFISDISEVTAAGSVLAEPRLLAYLARFTLHAFCQSIGNPTGRERARKTALLMTLDLEVPNSADEQDYNDSSTVPVQLTRLVGVPPVSEPDSRNLFGKAFVEAARIANARVRQDAFDEHIVDVVTDDVKDFLDALVTILEAPAPIH